MSIQNLDVANSIMQSLFFTQNVDYNINNLNVNEQAQLNQYYQVYNYIISNPQNPLNNYDPVDVDNATISLNQSLTIIDTTGFAPSGETGSPVNATVPPGQTNQMLTISLVNGKNDVNLTVENCFYNNTAYVTSDSNVQIASTINKTVGTGSITLTTSSPSVTLLNSMSVTGVVPQSNGLWVVISGSQFNTE